MSLMFNLQIFPTTETSSQLEITYSSKPGINLIEETNNILESNKKHKYNNMINKIKFYNTKRIKIIFKK